MFNEKNYTDFTESDFISDPYFQDWVMHSNAENDSFWVDFFEINPEKKGNAETARAFLLNLKFKEELPEEHLIKNLFARHLEDVQKIKTAEEVPVIRKNFRMNTLFKAAASFIGLVLIISAIIIINKKPNAVIVANEFGNIKTVILPDSSQVVLNANTTIRFHKNWNTKSTREVWLQGEAFFIVRHINQDSNNINSYDQFVVHTEELTVAVLGTSFDIRQRRGKTEIVLQAGRVRVSFNNQRTKDVILNPGEMLDYRVAGEILLKSSTSAENFSAWREKKLLLVDPTASEIAEYLEDYFGKKIIFKDIDLGNRKIEGPILLTNLDDALFILSTVLNTEIIRKDNTIILKSR